MESMRAVFQACSERAVASDTELLDAALSNHAAFATIYRRYSYSVFWYLLDRCGVQEDAADLTQYVFLRALEALPTYSDRGIPFRAWLFRVARNALTDAHRRRKYSIPWDQASVDMICSDSPSPEAIAVDAEAATYLDTLIAQLEPGKQELLALRFGSELEIAEIALVVGKSECAVRKRLQRIVQELKEQYRDA